MAIERTIHSQKKEPKICPECGVSMAAVDQCEENGVLFRWYECTTDDCDGQWLEKDVSA